MVIVQPVVPMCGGCRAQGCVLGQLLTSFVSPVWCSDTVGAGGQGEFWLELVQPCPAVTGQAFTLR